MGGRWKRASVFELLAGRNLHLAMKEAKGSKVEMNYRTLKDVIRKGIALGYIKESEYDRLVYDETT
jgi:competence protein ComGA